MSRDLEEFYHDVFDVYEQYSSNLIFVLGKQDWSNVKKLAKGLYSAWVEGKNVFLCGNGGSAGNALHLANDFVYAVGYDLLPGIRAEALSANSSLITCLANDVGYDKVYSTQLETKALAGDLLIALSGSGNSPNIVNALEMGNKLSMDTYAILGYSGGACLSIAKTPIHVAIDDMQISEDMQLIIGHICMKWLNQRTDCMKWLSKEK